MTERKKPRLAVLKFASCDGCQLSLLNCEDELLDLAELVQLGDFREATSTVLPGPFDVTLVEGSVTTPHDAARIQEVRRATRFLVTIGACATAGGIQALRNWTDVKEFAAYVYATPAYVSTLDRSTPISAHVKVDFELQGCPIDRRQLLLVLAAFLNGRRPRLPAHPVCFECKQAGHVCVVVARGTPCLGPVTHAGCGALCPSFDRGCYGCFGPSDRPETGTLARAFERGGATRPELLRLFRGINGWAPPFRRESEAHE